MTQQITKTRQVLQELGRAGGRPRAPSGSASHPPHPLRNRRKASLTSAIQTTQGFQIKHSFQTICTVTVFEISEWSKGGKRPRSDPLKVTSESILKSPGTSYPRLATFLPNRHPPKVVWAPALES